jgi:hypothetical protein
VVKLFVFTTNKAQRYTIRMRKCCLSILFIFVIGISSALAAKVEPIAKPKDSPVPDAIWQVLDPNGYHLTLDDGSAIDIWLRKDIPNSGKKEAEGAQFPELAPSTLVGVISFPKAGSDFRGQAIPAGYYSLRYELLPNDANHLGVSPNRDFVLLVPIASDPDPKAEFKYQELVALSRKATGSSHPAPLSIVQAGEKMPGIAKDDQDHWIFSAKLPIAGSEPIPFGLIVKGVAQQ